MPTSPKVLGYYASWNEAYPPKAIDYSLFTHLCHAFAVVQKAGELRLPDAAQTRDLCARAHAAGVKVLMSVGGEDSGRAYGRATATPEGVARFADTIVAAAKAGGYDGVDIDWEVPTNPAERDGMNNLIRALRERLPKGGLLTMAVSATDWGGKWCEKSALLPHVDWLNVMTYDFHGPWTDHAGHNSPLRYSPTENHPNCRAATIEASAEYWIKGKGWPADRLLLGVPLYGRGFQARKMGDPAKGSYARSEPTYNDILALQRKGWTRTWDDAAEVPILHSPDGTEVISYEDAEASKRKGQYAREKRYGGIFFWEISQDFDGRTNPVVRSARTGTGA